MDCTNRKKRTSCYRLIRANEPVVPPTYASVSTIIYDSVFLPIFRVRYLPIKSCAIADARFSKLENFTQKRLKESVSLENYLSSFSKRFLSFSFSRLSCLSSVSLLSIHFLHIDPSKSDWRYAPQPEQRVLLSANFLGNASRPIGISLLIGLECINIHADRSKHEITPPSNAP